MDATALPLVDELSTSVATALDILKKWQRTGLIAELPAPHTERNSIDCSIWADSWKQLATTSTSCHWCRADIPCTCSGPTT